MRFKELQDGLGYIFHDENLLVQAVTHSSFANEKNLTESNERLEFLGDAVLELVVSEMLFEAYPGAPEGALTKRRAAVVCEPNLAAVARSVSLGMVLRLGKGEAASGGFERDSILSDAVEAVFGAIYLDGGLDAAKKTARRLIKISGVYGQADDYKTRLQEILQRDGGETAVYFISGEAGPSHMKEFSAIVTHTGKTIGEGAGKNKKEAEQNAARAALASMGFI